MNYFYFERENELLIDDDGRFFERLKENILYLRKIAGVRFRNISIMRSNKSRDAEGKRHRHIRVILEFDYDAAERIAMHYAIGIDDNSRLHFSLRRILDGTKNPIMLISPYLWRNRKPDFSCDCSEKFCKHIQKMHPPSSEFPPAKK
jgi:hypothetical protein